MKLCVTRSSTLAALPPSMHSSHMSDGSTISLSSHTSFAEAEVSFKKELPGVFLVRRVAFDFVAVIALNSRFISNQSEKAAQYLPVYTTYALAPRK